MCWALGETLIDNNQKSPKICSMTPDEYELFAAQETFIDAMRRANIYNRTGPVHEGAVGILIRALELATPDLTPARRASLFTEEE